MKSVGLITVMLVLVPSTALLAPPRGHHGRHHMMRMGNFDNSDTNNDGKISKKEWKKFHEEVFEDMDDDNSGSIESNEW